MIVRMANIHIGKRLYPHRIIHVKKHARCDDVEASSLVFQSVHPGDKYPRVESCRTSSAWHDEYSMEQRLDCGVGGGDSSHPGSFLL